MARPKNAIPKEGESLADMYPELVSQWDYEKNSQPPTYYKPTSGVKAYWKCPVADDHEWVQTPNVRTGQNTGCPYCQNLAVSISNSLPSLFPEIASQWHPTKNGDKVPEEFVAYSGKRVWWKCPVADDHEWRTAIEKRTALGQGCPCCAYPIRKVIPSNSLASTHPSIAAEWDHEKNGKSPSEVAAGSSKKAYWICTEGHEYSQMISNRTGHKQGCPYCAGQKVLPDGSNSLGALYPDLVKEWDYHKNSPTTPWEVRPASHTKYHWKCMENSCEWESMVSTRTHFNSGCPNCAGYGIKPNLPGIYYVNAVTNNNGDILEYKGGVSNNHYSERFRHQQTSLKNNYPNLLYQHIEYISFSEAKEALEIERVLKNDSSRPSRDFDGGTELFLENPIDLAISMGLIPSDVERRKES